jgi:hypothetical protein
VLENGAPDRTTTVFRNDVKESFGPVSAIEFPCKAMTTVVMSINVCRHVSLKTVFLIAMSRVQPVLKRPIRVSLTASETIVMHFKMIPNASMNAPIRPAETLFEHVCHLTIAPSQVAVAAQALPAIPRVGVPPTVETPRDSPLGSAAPSARSPAKMAHSAGILAVAHSARKTV